MRSLIEERSKKARETEIQEEYLNSNDTVCRQVSNREPQLRKFSAAHDVIIFVSGKKSSNGKVLYEVCRSINPRSYFISDVNEIDSAWFSGTNSVGICGATSTPMWLMKKVETHLNSLDRNEQPEIRFQT
jgi:4-hydroxy-3-methylbut-2-enyl diphosphate reductase